MAIYFNGIFYIGAVLTFMGWLADRANGPRSTGLVLFSPWPVRILAFIGTVAMAAGIWISESGIFWRVVFTSLAALVLLSLAISANPRSKDELM